MYGKNTVNTHGMEYGRKGKKKTLNKNDPTNMPHPASEKHGRQEGRLQASSLADLSFPH